MQFSSISRSRAWWRGPLVAAALILALAVPSSALASGVTVKLHAPNHVLKLNRNWDLKVNVTKGGHKLSGKIRYQFIAPVFGVVHTDPWKKLRKGYYKYVLHPTTKSAGAGVGITLTLKVEVQTSSGTGSATWKVTIEN